MDLYYRHFQHDPSVLNDEDALRGAVMSLVTAISIAGGMGAIPANYFFKLEQTVENEQYIELLFETFDQDAQARELIQDKPIIGKLRFFYDLLWHKHAEVTLEPNLLNQFFLLKNDKIWIHMYLTIVMINRAINRQLKHDWRHVLSLIADESLPTRELAEANANLLEEIRLFLEDEEVPQELKQKFSEYRRICAAHVEQNVSRYINDVLEVMEVEHFIKSAETMDDLFNLQIGSSEIRRAFSDKLYNVIKRRTNKRIGRTVGGKREKLKVTWNDQMKMQFFLTVEGLPKIQGRRMWHLALQHLSDKDFNSGAIKALAAMGEFSGPEKELLKEAVKLWRADMVKGECSPRAFEFRHAIALLDYPQLSFESAKKYFNKGSRLYRTHS